MKDTYLDKSTRTVASLVEHYTPKWMIITRINVPKEFRGKKHGSEMLKRICEDADKEQIVLLLQVQSSGEMTDEQLTQWYTRYGFEPFGDYLRRMPK